jgi:adenylate cyclase
MAESSPRRKIAVILATDVVGYSTKMEENEDQTLKNLKVCRSIIDGLVKEYHGRIFNTAGDSVLVEFQSAVEAVICGSEFQNTIKERNNSVPEEEQMEFRIGINMGDVVIEGDNLYGEGVNVAARLEALAQPGGVCLAKNVHEIVNKKTDFQFHDLGEQTVKNTVVHAVDVTLDGTSQRKITEPSTEQQSSTEKPPAIAVLPFVNMSGDPEQEYFADGITEDIITNLSLWRTFPVISRNSSFTFRGKSQNLKQVANELGARYIVEGSVRKGGNRVRITAQLIDAEEDHHLWSEKWDRTLEDIFDVQDEVSETIARRVAPSVRGHEQNRLTRKRPENLSAWEEHLQGLQCYHERQRKDYEDLGLAQARQHFEKAIELDPTLSDGHSYLAFCGIWEIIQRITKDSKQTLNSVLASARQAQVLNPENPVALGVMACYYLFLGDQAIARDFAKKAIGFNPSYAANYFFLAAIQAHYGEFQEAESSALKTIELSPVDPELGEFFIPLSYSYLGQCKYEEALEAVEKTLQQYPENGFSLGTRAAILGHLERGSEGKIALDRYLALRPNLKTRANFRSSFTPNSVLADPMIEGLIKAGWKPED